ncbi:NAD(P)-dependent oxidoreductase [Vagococcus xieshaowenii]|uniref:NAD(P)-dependent oxidoreductase n=1 Tax=Vagococcus xieshaowenii TaxID=2562451 RepID=A0AAJ5EDM0_9ENTE|nr:NAD(P)-binding oxidoreductase [Vagococcus xieshaowenii]QCA28148.1 NAD(P)-dependent oxidoreductase [Vagococcus xieshaowenii]TFZ39726.1 NAD(P)-dependent oxidoreductase [Vagococcus xieshaowenii]
MKLLILGASGRTGQELVKQALEAGHDVIVYVRNADSLRHHKHLKIIQAPLTDQKKLASAISLAEAILVTLGNPQADKNVSLFEWVIPMLISLMEDKGVKRLIIMSALGVGNTYRNAPIHYKLAAKTFLRGAFKDHLLGESRLWRTELDWTTIHPGILTDKDKTTTPFVVLANSGYQMPVNSSTNRSDVAQVMLNILNDKNTYAKELIVSSNTKIKL